MESPKILIVDDNEDLCTIFKEALEEEGYKISTAVDGKQALAEAKKTHFDLIITDKNMPRMGGIRLVRSIRELDPDTKIVLITGFGGKQSYIKATELGADEYLSKPLRIGDLKKFVSNIIRSSPMV